MHLFDLFSKLTLNNVLCSDYIQRNRSHTRARTLPLFPPSTRVSNVTKLFVETRSPSVIAEEERGSGGSLMLVTQRRSTLYGIINDKLIGFQYTSKADFIFFITIYTEGDVCECSSGGGGQNEASKKGTAIKKYTFVQILFIFFYVRPMATRGFLDVSCWSDPSC